MSPNDPSGISAALTAERTALVSFITLLEREQSMLVGNGINQLLELSEQKSSDALCLNKLAEARHTLLQKNIPGLSADTIHAWLAAHSPQSLVVWRGVRALAERAQKINRINGKLIKMKLHHNQQSLAVLSNAVNRANLYGADGQPNLSLGSGRSLGSG